MSNPNFGVGDKVMVDPFKNDIFDTFTGRIIAIKGDLFCVEDQNEDCWDVEAGQMTLVKE